MVVSARGYDIIVSMQLKNRTPVSMELIAGGRSGVARIELLIEVA